MLQFKSYQLPRVRSCNCIQSCVSRFGNVRSQKYIYLFIYITTHLTTGSPPRHHEDYQLITKRFYFLFRKLQYAAPQALVCRFVTTYQQQPFVPLCHFRNPLIRIKDAKMLSRVLRNAKMLRMGKFTIDR